MWISKTVLLETAWVLESVYGFREALIRDAITGLIGMDDVHAEDEADVVAALQLATQGVELADALHLMSRPHGAAFVSFDQTLVKRANRAGVAGVASPI